MPEKDKNSQEGPDVRGNLIKINVDGDTIFADSNQYKPQIEHVRKLKQQHRRPKNPKLQEWVSEEYSKHRITGYKPLSFVDGEGVRYSLYVSGCLFGCPGHCNLAAQNFSYGRLYTRELEDKTIEDMSQFYVQGLALLDGKLFLNAQVHLKLTSHVRKEFGHTKDIWSWSGYTWSELQKETPGKKEIFSEINTPVDGRFMDDSKGLALQSRGSNNQRIIDARKSLKAKKVVIWDKLVR